MASEPCRPGGMATYMYASDARQATHGSSAHAARRHARDFNSRRETIMRMLQCTIRFGSRPLMGCHRTPAAVTRCAGDVRAASEPFGPVSSLNTAAKARPRLLRLLRLLGMLGACSVVHPAVIVRVGAVALGMSPRPERAGLPCWNNVTQKCQKCCLAPGYRMCAGAQPDRGFAVPHWPFTLFFWAVAC